MIFKFKEKEIVLDCFTARGDVYSAFPIESAIKHMPDWWKALPKEVVNDFFPAPTMKTCAGMVELYKQSYSINLWSDLAIQVVNGEDYRWQFSDLNSEMELHHPNQRGAFLPKEKYVHMKIKSPWVFECSKPIKWMWSQPTYSFDTLDDIWVLPGIVDYYTQGGTNINFGLSVRPRTLNLHCGMPLVHMTPLYDGNIKVVNHLVSDAEFDSLSSFNLNSSFINAKKTLNKFREKARCPYMGDEK